jgi:hypothetical protein
VSCVDFGEKISPAFAPETATKPLPSMHRTVAALLFSPRPRHVSRAASFLLRGPPFRNDVPDGAEGNGDMRQISSMLRSAPARIGRRFAELVAIAAASLPAAGA